MTDGDRPLDDQLNMAIGRVARAHVGAEINLCWLWTGLMGGLSSYIVGGQSFDRLREDCRMLLQKLEPPAELLAAGLSILDDLKEANEGRNSAVHNHWLQVPIGPDGPPVLQVLRS